MRIHTSLTMQEIREALRELQFSEDIASDVELVWLSQMPSRSHSFGYEMRLGTYLNDTNPYRNNGRRYRADATNLHSDNIVYAAAYDEWGWMLAKMFDLDPDMKTSSYKSIGDFHKKTGNKFQ
jgi:hypothetical protein